MDFSAASGRYWMDGRDLWDVFGVIVEDGSEGFLKLPAKKDSITHDWIDQDGIEVDLTNIFFHDRDITLTCVMIADNETDFWIKRSAFIAQLRQPGARRIEINELGARSFYVYYKENTGFNRYTRILEGNVVCRFLILFCENEPTEPTSDDVFIVDEDGRFLVT